MEEIYRFNYHLAGTLCLIVPKDVKKQMVNIMMRIVKNFCKKKKEIFYISDDNMSNEVE